MIHFDYDDVMKRHNVLVPFTLGGESSDMTVASISEDNKITMHRELRIDFVRQILMQWDEHSHQLRMKDRRKAGEFDELFNDNNLFQREQIRIGRNTMIGKKRTVVHTSGTMYGGGDLCGTLYHLYVRIYLQRKI